jgi:enoyl-CoA hydratase/carnithine racemase
MISLGDLVRLRVEVSDFVATVRITAPPVNAQDHVFREEISHVFDVLGHSGEVRAIILTGNEQIFSAGADLSQRNDIQSKLGGHARHNRSVREFLDAVMTCPKPVIAAVNGPAVGGGCVLALSCDILLVAEEAFMSMTEVDFGLAGGVSYIQRAFSRSDARLMYFTAKRITGQELYRMNVASACVPRSRLLDEARSIAHTIAAKVPMAIEVAKRSFGLVEEMTVRDGYLYEQTQTAALSNTQDSKEALLAFREKRKPNFTGQ